MMAWKRICLALSLAAGVALGGTAEAMMSDDEQQLDVLSSQNQIWEKEMCIGEAVAQDGKFAVTDLDHNGRLELLFTTTAGDCVAFLPTGAVVTAVTSTCAVMPGNSTPSGSSTSNVT